MIIYLDIKLQLISKNRNLEKIYMKLLFQNKTQFHKLKLTA
jgi:hypothetical protein